MQFFQKMTMPLFFVFAFLPVTSHAFSLGDHKRVTQQALEEFNACNPDHSVSRWNGIQMWSSNLEEDLNVVRKDLMFSHFYNPYKKLNMWRYDSSDRIKGLMLSLKLDSAMYGDNSKDIYQDLGHIAHHVQDMASPPHVVPVMHGLADGFENDVDFKGDISSGLNCDQIRSAGANVDYITVLNEVGYETLKRVDETSIPVQATDSNGKTLTPEINASAFWNQGERNEFGRYGVLGNHFGKVDFVQDKVKYHIPASFYSDYKKAQLKLAVQGTLRVLSVYLLNR